MIVYTALIGKYDKLLPVPAHRPKDSRFVCFSDIPVVADGWEVRPITRKFNDPTREARWYKTHPHELFPKVRRSLWLDANFTWRIDPEPIFGQLQADMACFEHDSRSCIYQELLACLERSKDTPELMRKQVARYRSAGYPANNGLWMTFAVFRNHTPAVIRLCNAWWAEIAAGSRRDQLSLPYVAWRSRTPVDRLSGELRDTYFEKHPHVSKRVIKRKPRRVHRRIPPP